MSLDNDTQSQCEICGSYDHNTAQHDGGEEPTEEEKKEYLHALYELTAEALGVEPGKLGAYVKEHKIADKDMPHIHTDDIARRVAERRLR